MTRVVVADDQDLVRSGLAMVLDARPRPGGGFAVTAAIPCDPVPEPA